MSRDGDSPQFFSSPRNQMQAHALRGCNVLFSFALRFPMLEVPPWRESFAQILIDSGAYSVMARGVTVDIAAYGEYAQVWSGRAAAIAGLDDISGDWKQSLKNYEAVPCSFPTFHDSDPEGLLPELIAMAQERGTWIGLGVVPKGGRTCNRRHARHWVARTVERIPAGLHVHGWALGGCASIVDSYDSTNWMLDCRKVLAACPWLTPAEALDLIVLRDIRRSRQTTAAEDQDNGQNCFAFGWD
jgi:hypothetical protein